LTRRIVPSLSGATLNALLTRSAHGRGLMSGGRLPTFERLQSIFMILDFRIECTDGGGMGPLAHFSGGCPLVKFRQKAGFHRFKFFGEMIPQRIDFCVDLGKLFVSQKGFSYRIASG
jgi:hypothetical protein